MFRVVAHQFGLPEQVLVYEPAEKPVLEPGYVLVQMRASTINPSDLISIAGAYRHRTSLPFVPGYDGVGVIMETGSGVDRMTVGRRVLPLGSPGNWQTWKCVRADWCVSVPDDFSDGEAALAYVNPLTARLMVKALAPQPGDRIGVTAAASAIGRMLVRMLAAVGARPVAIVRSQLSRTILLDEPAAQIIQEGASLPVLASGLDAVGGVSGARLAAAIKPDGLLLHYGLLSGQPLTGALLADAKADVRLFRLRDWVHTASRAALHTAMGETFAEIRAGQAASPIAATYPLRAFQEAIAHNMRSNCRGKIILTFGDEFDAGGRVGAVGRSTASIVTRPVVGRTHVTAACTPAGCRSAISISP